jgi:type I restriction enzyme M protein
MLDSETRRRIDTARDILVGKVPDPKSQVEQITIALVYKFMDDMDKQSIEMGGKASFFKGEFKKYGWSNIFDPRLGGVEMLNLYGEAITRMSQNDNLPELFRNIFKNAFLPYRDPETLKLFLKTVNEFTYDHSEKLGDAFEYLLSVLGSQGDAGQFRTPRHIIDFMVQVLGPKKNETVLDPACGTAGFLIAAYKYIINTPSGFATSPKSDGTSVGFGGGKGGGLTAQEKQNIYKNFTGYDISPDMVRLSLVNLYLHGFVTPNIHEYDTLTSEERWNEYADVILANPPFMSPKGGIQPHKRFSVQSNRSEVLFVDYMAEHLTPNGRAAIIVPEGIIFQSAGAYKQLRKYLVENNYLWAVVSLPAGVFNPYAGVKTSILFLDKALAKKTDQILFVKVEADGFDLGAQRRPIDRNDLPDALNTLHAWHKAVLDGKPASFSPTIASPKGTMSALLVSTSRLAENKDYNLSADRYRETIRNNHKHFPMVTIGEVCDIFNGSTPSRKELSYWENGAIPWFTIDDIREQGRVIRTTKQFITTKALEETSVKLLPENAVLLCCTASVGEHAIIKIPVTTNQQFNGLVIKNEYIDKLLPEFLFHLAGEFKPLLMNLGGTTAFKFVSVKDLKTIQIPLPPLETQRQIVDEIAAHQRIIDGARQVVDGWKPTFDIDPEWRLVKLGDITETSSGGTPLRSKKEYYDNGTIPWVKSGEVAQGFVSDTEEKITELGLKNSSAKIFPKDTVLVAIYGATAGQVGLLKIEATTNQAVCGIFPNEKYIPEYLYLVLKTKTDYMVSISSGGAQPNISQTIIRQLEIPLPPLEVQREIVARIERERSIVEGNRELIRIYEEKVKKVIERVWEG